MNSKHYVGRKASSIETTGQTAPVTGVRLTVDETTAYEAGDMTGSVLEADCPYGTQAMADAVLAAVKGKSYTGYEAKDTAIPVEAELGDGITVRGVYSPLAERTVSFGPGHLSDIAAPGDEQVSHEYGYTDPVQRAIERRSAQTRSYVDKTADNIKLGVEQELSGQKAEIDIQLGQITSTVESQGGDITTLQQTAETLSSTVQDQGGDISELQQTASSLSSTVQSQGDSLSTLEQTAETLSSTVQGHTGDISKLQQTAETLTSTVESQGGDISTLQQTASSLSSTVQSQGGALSTLQQTTSEISASVKGFNDSLGEVKGDLSLKVGRDENNQIVSMLNASTNAINIETNRLSVKSTNFTLAKDGTITAKNGNFSGSVTATSGTIGGFKIGGGPDSYTLSNGTVNLTSTMLEVEGDAAHAAAKTTTITGGAVSAGTSVTSPKFIGTLEGPFCKVLWSNSSPASSFRKTTLYPTGMSNYNLFFVIQNFTASNPSYTAGGVCYRPAGNKLGLITPSFATSSGNGHASTLRIYTFNSSSVEISEGRSLNNSGVTEDSSYAIPLAILAAKV